MSREQKEGGRKRGERAEKFWRAFRLTENGKPKSGLGVYTFSLSIVFGIVYALCYEGAIRLITEPLAGLPVQLSNLIIALTASIVGVCICCIPHRFFADKRLVFGSHLWLVLYAVLALVTVLIMLRGQGGAGAFLQFFGWFILIPVFLGTLVSWLLCRQDRPKISEKPPEPEWKKYVKRR